MALPPQNDKWADSPCGRGNTARQAFLSGRIRHFWFFRRIDRLNICWKRGCICAVKSGYVWCLHSEKKEGVVKWGEIWRSRNKKKLNQKILIFVLFYFSQGENIFIYAKFSCENMRIKLLNTNFLIRMCVYVKLKIAKMKFLSNDKFTKILNKDA